MYKRKLFIEVEVYTDNHQKHNDVEDTLHELIVKVTGKIKDVRDETYVSVKYDIWTNPEN